MRRESDIGHARGSLSRGSLSGDLLGKFSAIVRPRRASQAGDNNSGGGGGDLPILEHQPLTDSDVDPSFSDYEGTTPSAAKGFGFHSYMRRFSRATTAASAAEDYGGGGAAPLLRRMLDGDEPERQRRFDLEIMSFAILHDHMAPPPGLVPEDEEDDDDEMDDNQVEEALFRAGGELADDDDFALDRARRKSRETTTDADEYAVLEAQDDDDEEEEDALLVLRLKRQDDASEGDEEDEEEEEEEETNHHEESELNFDPAHLGASVRRLVREIENASFQEEEAQNRPADASGASNQDEEEPSTTQQQQQLEDDKEAYAARHSDPLALSKPSRRITYPVVITNSFHAPPTAPPPRRGGFLPPSLPAHAPFVDPNCYIPMDEVQEDLTKSVRRLVIGLKDQAEAAQADHGLVSFAARRRGNSCPQPYSPAPPVKSSAADSSASTAASLSMDTGPAEPPRWRKRSTLARLAPKFLDTFRRKRKSYLYTDEELESIEGARWKIVDLAFRFGGKHRVYLVQAVNMFFPLIKYGRHGGPHPTRLHCNKCGTLQWQHKRGGLSEPVDLADVLQIIEGRQTSVFRKYVSCQELDSLSLSLIFKERTLDLETQSASHRDWLMTALRTLVTYAKKQRQAENRALAERALLPLDDMSEGSSSLSRSRVELLARLNEHDGSNVAGPVALW